VLGAARPGRRVVLGHHHGQGRAADGEGRVLEQATAHEDSAALARADAHAAPLHEDKRAAQHFSERSAMPGTQRHVVGEAQVRHHRGTRLVKSEAEVVQLQPAQ